MVCGEQRPEPERFHLTHRPRPHDQGPEHRRAAAPGNNPAPTPTTRPRPATRQASSPQPSSRKVVERHVGHDSGSSTETFSSYHMSARHICLASLDQNDRSGVLRLTLRLSSASLLNPCEAAGLNWIFTQIRELETGRGQRCVSLRLRSLARTGLEQLRPVRPPAVPRGARAGPR